MRVAVIVNPIAGRGPRRATTGSERSALARAWLTARAIDAEVVATRDHDHAVDLAASFVARGFDRIIAWGGDGTINQVAGPLIGARVTLGLVPGGSGDGLARGLGVPRDVPRAFAIALGPSTRRLDVGWLAGRHFLNVAGIGFDAAVARAFNRRQSRGMRGYVSAGLTGVWNYRPSSYDLNLNGVRSFGERLLIAFANGRQYGNGFILAPDADPGDGWLDAVIVDGGSAFRQLWRARRLFVWPREPAEGITRVRLRSARVSADVSLCQVDGETFESRGVLDVTLTPGALGVAVPAMGSPASVGG